MHDIFIYDLSCLIAQQVSTTPSGTIRVDLRYAHYFLHEKPQSTIFIRQHNGQLVIVENDDVQALIKHLFEIWDIDKDEAEITENTARNLEFRMQHHDLWDPDFDTFYSMPYSDRFNYLANQELTDILGSEFSWVKKLPYLVKISYAAIASLSRHLALFLIRFAQFVGVYLHTRKLSLAGKFVFTKRKRTLASPASIRERFSKQENQRYFYVYTAYNRGFPFRSLKNLARSIQLEYVVFIHDLVIIDYPEYFLPVDHLAQHDWMKHLLKQAPLILTNSQTTKSRIEDYAGRHGQEIRPVITSYIGVEPHFLNSRARASAEHDRHYFIFISTIEPRKNHLLLLNIWREMARHDIDNTPELYLVGKRGWENENIIDMVERCPSIKGLVHELSDIKDRELIDLLVGARALLYPSFCEGWGMPIAEALSLGVPAICSDIPELRESGQDIPEYISPIDGKQWKEIIEDYNQPGSRLRQQQLTRIKDYIPPTWESHFRTSLDAIRIIQRP